MEKTLALTILLALTACDAPPKADPACREYVAVPGEPCRDGHWLWVSSCENKTPVCRCDAAPSR